MHACIYICTCSIYYARHACNLYVFIDCAVILPNENPVLTDVMDSVSVQQENEHIQETMEVISAACTEESDSLLKSQGLLCACIDMHAVILLLTSYLQEYKTLLESSLLLL